MRIGELAKRAGVSVQAIRFYERRRLMRTPRGRPRDIAFTASKTLRASR